MARSFGLEAHMISAAEAEALFPLMSRDGVLGAAYIPSDGHVDPASLCQAIARGARTRGVRIREGVAVSGFATEGRRITRVETSDGPIAAETVVIAAGMWSRELAAGLGVNAPACALEHQYIVTEPIPGMPDDLPNMRDPDRLVYYKPDAGGRLVIGGLRGQHRAVRREPHSRRLRPAAPARELRTLRAAGDARRPGDPGGQRGRRAPGDQRPDPLFDGRRFRHGPRARA